MNQLRKNKMTVLEVNYDKQDREYVATVSEKKFKSVFSGRGKTQTEAIGDCIISNRETLGFSFFGKDKKGNDWISVNSPESTLKIAASKKEKIEKIIESLDKLIADAPLDFLGTGSCTKWANECEKEFMDTFSHIKSLIRNI